MGWSIVGGLTCGILFPTISDAMSWGAAGAILSIGIALPMAVTVFATRGRDKVPDGLPAPAPIWSIFSVLKVPEFIRVVILFVVGWSSVSVLSSLVPFYVEHHMQAPGQVDGIFAVIQISALLAIPLASFLARRYEKHVAAAVLLATWGIALVALSAVPSGQVTLSFIIAGMVGPGVAAAHVLPWAILPDVVDVDKRRRGEGRDGAFYGMMTFVEKAVTAGALGLVGVVLELSGYVEGGDVQPESAHLALRVLIGPVPAVVLVAVAFYIWRRPPVTRAQFQELGDS